MASNSPAHGQHHRGPGFYKVRKRTHSLDLDHTQYDPSRQRGPYQNPLSPHPPGAGSDTAPVPKPKRKLIEAPTQRGPSERTSFFSSAKMPADLKRMVSESGASTTSSTSSSSSSSPSTSSFPHDINAAAYEAHSRSNETKSSNLSFLNKMKLSDESGFFVVSTALSATLTAPLARLSFRFQTHREYYRLLSESPELMASPQLNNFTRNPVSFFYTHLVQQEGMLQLFRGNLLHVAREIPSHFLSLYLAQALQSQLYTNTNYLDLMSDETEQNAQTQSSQMMDMSDSALGRVAQSLPQWVGNVLIGGVTGALPLMALYPMQYVYERLVCDASGIGTFGLGREHVKNLMEAERDRLGRNRSFAAGYRFLGGYHCAEATVARHGFAGLYTGLPMALAGVFVYRGIYFGAYEMLRKVDGGMENFAIGYGVTLTARMLSYPLETVRLRVLMNQCMDGKVYGRGQKNVYVECFKTIIQEEGATWLLRGFGVHLVTSLAGALCLSYFDMMREASKA